MNEITEPQTEQTEIELLKQAMMNMQKQLEHLNQPITMEVESPKSIVSNQAHVKHPNDIFCLKYSGNYQIINQV